MHLSLTTLLLLLTSTGGTVLGLATPNANANALNLLTPPLAPPHLTPRADIASTGDYDSDCFKAKCMDPSGAAALQNCAREAAAPNSTWADRGECLCRSGEYTRVYLECTTCYTDGAAMRKSYEDGCAGYTSGNSGNGGGGKLDNPDDSTNNSTANSAARSTVHLGGSAFGSTSVFLAVVVSAAIMAGVVGV
ncbi:hypothetical protein DFH27DRAFT_561868 [Peziza echinospora]|nr:hypothetical protein DFH27DRAFT_561868 [Peziza echinospora]